MVKPRPAKYWEMTVAKADPATPSPSPATSQMQRIIFKTEDRQRKIRGMAELPMARRLQAK